MAEACENHGADLHDGPRLDALVGVAKMFPWPMGRLSYEKAQILARHLDKGDLASWIGNVIVAAYSWADSSGSGLSH